MGNYLFRMLFSRKLEVVIVGLGNCGKTTLLHVLSDGVPVQTVPTVGLNVRMIKKGGVQMKCWDLAGGEQYRNEWGRFTKGCDVIIFVVDANAIHLLPDAKMELHRLLEDKELAKTAVLIVANKIDLEPHASEPLLIRGKAQFKWDTYYYLELHIPFPCVTLILITISSQHLHVHNFLRQS